MPETKEFSLRDVLTVITGRLLTVPTEESNGIESLYSILEWMTGEPPFTHQLPRFAQECKPYLLEWFPELSLALAADGSLQKWIDSDQTANKQEGIRMWLTELKMMNSAIKDAYTFINGRERVYWHTDGWTGQRGKWIRTRGWC